MIILGTYFNATMRLMIGMVQHGYMTSIGASFLPASYLTVSGHFHQCGNYTIHYGDPMVRQIRPHLQCCERTTDSNLPLKHAFCIRAGHMCTWKRSTTTGATNDGEQALESLCLLLVRFVDLGRYPKIVNIFFPMCNSFGIHMNAGTYARPPLF